MQNDVPSMLARSDMASLIAPAGYGKTEIITRAVALSVDKRQLILTHTNAGADSLRKRFKAQRVQTNQYQVDTIASFCLRFTSSYPTLSGLTNNQPMGEEWANVYDAMSIFLNSTLARRVLQSSYDGIYVDEYQDCTIAQHQIVMKLAEMLPCRIVGDPLQGIFDFTGESLITWDKHIAPYFKNIDGLNNPWRWQSTNPKLGAWLTMVRGQLMNGAEIDLRSGPLKWNENTFANQRKVLYDLANKGTESVIGLHKWPHNCHKMASNLGGIYGSMEEIECKELTKWASEIESVTGFKRVLKILDFAAKCKTQIGTSLSSFRKYLEVDTLPSAKNRKNNNHLVPIFQKVAVNNDLATIDELLNELHKLPGNLYRKELWFEMLRSVRLYGSGEFTSLADAVWYVRNRTRVIGRSQSLKTISRTVLVKGLEYHHAVILNADELNMKNFYVAITRGSTSLTVLSKSPQLRFS